MPGRQAVAAVDISSPFERSGLRVRFAAAGAALLLAACGNGDPGPDTAGGAPGELTVIAESHDGSALETFGAHLLDPEEGWLAPPDETREAEDGRAVLRLRGDGPHIVRVDAPGHRPFFVFLLAPAEGLRLSARLGAPARLTAPRPAVVGDFGTEEVDMEEREDGRWVAEIETDRERFRYGIAGFTAMTRMPGEEGRSVVREGPRQHQAGFLREVARKRGEGPVRITFDPAAVPEPGRGDLSLGGGEDPALEGVARVFHVMTSEVLSSFEGEEDHHAVGEGGPYDHDLSGFRRYLERLEAEYGSRRVIRAAALADAFFGTTSPYDELSQDDAEAILESVPGTSPLWLFWGRLLGDIAGRADAGPHLDRLEEAAAAHPARTIRAEAWFALVQHHHEEGNEDRWHAAFDELTSRFAGHWRVTQAYAEHAPEDPVEVGERLAIEAFGDPADPDRTVDLRELEGDYVLLNFWSPGCAASVDAVPELSEVQGSFAEDGVTVAGVALTADVEAVEAVRTEHGATWPMAVEDPREGRAAQELGIMFTPRFLLLGPDREVVADHGPELSRAEVRETLEGR